MTEKECLNALCEQMNFAQAIGILVNMRAESAYNENALGDLKDGKYTSYGLCQWHGKRWERLQNYSGMITSIPVPTQISFLLWEMEKYYPKTWKVFNEIPDDKSGAERFAYYFCYNYEVPANRQSSSEKRSVAAGDLYDKHYIEPVDSDTIIADALLKIMEVEEILKKWKRS